MRQGGRGPARGKCEPLCTTTARPAARKKEKEKKKPTFCCPHTGSHWLRQCSPKVRPSTAGKMPARGAIYETSGPHGWAPGHPTSRCAGRWVAFGASNTLQARPRSARIKCSELVLRKLVSKSRNVRHRGCYKTPSENHFLRSVGEDHC